MHINVFKTNQKMTNTNKKIVDSNLLAEPKLIFNQTKPIIILSYTLASCFYNIKSS